MIEVTCPQCGQAYRLAEGLAGKRGKCKRCGHTLAVPHGKAAPSPPVVDLYDLDDGEPPHNMEASSSAPFPLPARKLGGKSARSANQKSGRSNRWLVPSVLVGVVVVGLVSVLIATRGRPAKAPATPPEDDQEHVVAATATIPVDAVDPQAQAPPLASTAAALSTPPPLTVTIPESLQAEIDQLEARLAAQPEGFDYMTYHDLRDRYYKAGDKRRVAYLCEVIFSHLPYDDYTLNCMGAWAFNGPKAPGFLLEWPESFPEYRRVAAACRLKAAALLDDASRAEELLQAVERMEGVEIDPYRAGFRRCARPCERTGRSHPP